MVSLWVGLTSLISLISLPIGCEWRVTGYPSTSGAGMFWVLYLTIHHSGPRLISTRC